MWIKSDSAKTPQRPAIRAGFSDFKAVAPNSSIGTFNLCAWWSRKLPVPAAQTVFIAKSVTIPSRKIIILLSCPPISKIVCTFGILVLAATACAVISFLTTSAPTNAPAKFRPEPVVPTPCTEYSCNA